MIIAFKAPSPLAGLTELPSRIKIGKWGRNETGKGAGFTINERTAAVLPMVQHKLSFDRVALDFQHNTCPTVDADGKTVEPKEPQKIAAMGTPRVVKGEGLFLENLDWTPEGKEAALGGHYPDLSPAVKMNDAGEVLFLHSAGLCRQGDVMDLQLFSAALNAGQLVKFSAALTSTSNNMDHKKLLLILLGLPETATDSDIETGAKAFAAKIGNVGEVTAFSASLKTLTENVGALTSRLEKADKDAVLAQAIRDGKVVPFSAQKLGLADFTALVAELPANVVPLAQRTIEGVKTFSASVTGQGGGDNAADAEVARQMGNDPEKVKKFGGMSRVS